MGFELEITREVNDIFGDGIGYVHEYDFSASNLSDETRLNAVTTVASICYGNKNAVGSENLYNRLANESAGLPNSSFEFVPVLLSHEKYTLLDALIQMKGSNIDGAMLNVDRYGEYIEHNDEMYLLTNLRAVMTDDLEFAKTAFNNELDVAIIKEHVKTFKMKIDLNTRSQIVRHRGAHYQELSRRYVDEKREPFEFYISPRVSEVGGFQHLISNSVDLYNKLRESGVKPEEARRVLPQSLYSTIWVQMHPRGFKNFLNLRLDKHSQFEIQQVAKAMQGEVE